MANNKPVMAFDPNSGTMTGDVFKMLIELGDRARAANTRLAATRIRLFGPWPEKAKETTGQEHVDCAEQAMRFALGRLHMALEEIENHSEVLVNRA